MGTLAMASYPVRLSSDFFSEKRASDAVHAVQYPASSSTSSSGSKSRSLRVKGNHVELHSQNPGAPVLQGDMRVPDGHDCVLLFDEASKTYVLHRLATVSNLSASTSSGPRQGTPAGSHTPAVATPNKASPASRHRDANPNPSSSPTPSQQKKASFGLGISAPSSSGLARPSNGKERLHAEVEEFDFHTGDTSPSVPNASRTSGGLALPATAAAASPPKAAAASPLQLPKAAAAPVAVPPPQPRQQGHKTVPGATAAALGSSVASLLVLDDSDDDDDVEFDNLAMDLESTLVDNGRFDPPPQQPQPAVQPRQPTHTPVTSAVPAARPTTSGKKVPKSAINMDSDIASSSESDDDSD